MTKKLLVAAAIVFSLAIPGAFAKDATPAADAPAAHAAKTKKAKRSKRKHGAAEAPAK